MVNKIVKCLGMLAVTALLFAGCDLPGKSGTTDPGQPVPTSKVQFSFVLGGSATQLSVGGPAEALGDDPSEDVVAVLMSVKDSGGDFILNKGRINVYQMGATFITEPVSITGSDGDYIITEFLVMIRDEGGSTDSSHIGYATPIAGSLRENEVLDPLPRTFSVADGYGETMILEVVEIGNDDSPEDFGYEGFIIDDPGYSITEGLVGQYIFDGNTADSSGSGNDASSVGCDFAADRNGQAGNALSLQDAADVITLDSAVGGDRISVSLWYYYQGPTVARNTLLSTNVNNGHRLMAIDAATQEIGFQNTAFYSSGYRLETGEWYHLAVTANGSQFRMYVNGELIQNDGNGFSNDAFPLALIGNRPGANQFAQGTIDDIRVYDRVLYGREVEMLYEEELPEITITYPSASGTVSGTVSITADASDDSNIEKVDFYAGGTLVGTDTTEPYAVDWNTKNGANATFNISAKATDIYGNVGIDRVNAVTVNNAQDISAISIANGQYFSVVLKDDGKVYACGYNGNGELGDGSAVSYSTTLAPVNASENITAVAAGNNHVLALKNDGTVWAWGDNSAAQLGDGSTIDKFVPIKINGLDNVVAVECGYYHSLALKNDGTVWAWGRNNYGQSGQGTTSTYTYTPVQVPGLENVVSVSAGNEYSMALLEDGTVYAWGFNNFGKLGNGNATYQTSPVPVQGLTRRVTAISCGDHHSHAVYEDGTVMSWGYNGNGELGNGAVTTVYTPVKVNGLTNVRAISAGQNFTLALKSDGSVWGWGYDTEYPIGVGNTTSKIVPIKIEALSDIVFISAGTYRSSLAVDSSGQVYSWGNNGNGCLGLNNTATQPTPQSMLNADNIAVPSVSFAAPPAYTAPDPELIANKIAGGEIHSLAINPANNEVWAWGHNGNGRLGEGTVGNNYPAMIRNTTLVDIISVSAGASHSLALEDDGTIWAFGNNASGQLGLGDNSQRTTPVPIPTLTNMIAVEAGWDFSLALKDDGTVWAWGYDGHGELGFGTTASVNTPVKVNGLTNVVQIGAGMYFSAALKDDGTVWAWGYNGYGELGEATGQQKLSPMKVETLKNIVKIAVRGSHFLALDSDGYVWAAGYNGYGELGDCTTNSTSVTGSPVMVNGIYDIVDIAAGSDHSMALKSDGTLWVWGFNNVTQLGDGTGSNKYAPVLLTSFTTDVVAIYANCGTTLHHGSDNIYHHSFAVTDDGIIWSWGRNNYAELGNGTQSYTPDYLPAEIIINW